MRQPFKRAFDLLLTIPTLFALAPVLLTIAAALRLADGGPLFFRQVRPGKAGRPFTLLKFRTMNEACDCEGRLLPDRYRLTGLGRWLRSFSLDELPQLWNVVRGDMSLVGPRPLLMEYLERYTPEQARRHQVKPGITGWAQINGRQDICFSERLRRDVWYVDHWSLRLDVSILARTFLLVLRGEGVRSGQDVHTVDDIGLTEGLEYPERLKNV